MLIIIQPVDPFKAPPPLSNKGNYNGTSRANIYKKQATLCKAAAGLAKISRFFISIPKPSKQPIEVLKIESSSSEDTSSDSGDKDGIDIPSIPLELHTPVPSTQSLTWLSCCQIIIYLTITQTWSHQQSPFSIWLQMMNSDQSAFLLTQLLQDWSRMLQNIRFSVPSSSSMLSGIIWNYMSITDSSQTSKILQCEPVSQLQSLWGRVLTSPTKSGTLSFTLKSFALFHHQELANAMPTPLSSTMNEYIRPCDVIWQFKKPEWFVTLNNLLRGNSLAYGQISPIKLQHEVNETIIPGLGLNLGRMRISENCARHWLKRLGYELTTAKKGIYVDGHEWPDVVNYHKTFLNTIAENEHLQDMYSDKDLEIIQPTLNPGTTEQKHIPVHHNKSIFRSNKLQQRVWVMGRKMPLRKKGQGKAIHVSDFITKEMGHLSLSEEQVFHSISYTHNSCNSFTKS